MQRSALEQRVTERWYRKAPAPPLLQPLSWLYRALTHVRRSAYATGWLRTQRVGKPVVVIGNLTVGGTGKTPLVIWLARKLTERGLTVGIVSRGYGRLEGALAARLVNSSSTWEEVGDEPMLLHERTGCATVVARDRVAGAEVLVAAGADVIIADDGLQHLRLARDCEIVVVDGARGFGNGSVLPAGPLREPVSRLHQVDLLIVNGTPEHPSLIPSSIGSGGSSEDTPFVHKHLLQMRLVPGDAVSLGGRTPHRPLEHFRGQPIHAVAGIGNPARFFRDLRDSGLSIIEHAFPDHHPFTAADLAFADGHLVLMTEKDAVKCRVFADARLWFVPVDAAFGETHERKLLEYVMRKLDCFSGAGDER